MTIAVEVVQATAAEQRVVRVELAEGSTVREALERAGLMPRFAAIAHAGVGVFGKATALDAELRDGDRVEVYRPLPEDPKEVRRRRAALGKKNRGKQDRG